MSLRRSSFAIAVFLLIFSFILVSVPRTPNSSCSLGFPSSMQIDSFPLSFLFSLKSTAFSPPPFSFLRAGRPSLFMHQLQPLLLSVLLPPVSQLLSSSSIIIIIIINFLFIFLKEGLVPCTMKLTLPNYSMLPKFPHSLLNTILTLSFDI